MSMNEWNEWMDQKGVHGVSTVVRVPPSSLSPLFCVVCVFPTHYLLPTLLLSTLKLIMIMIIMMTRRCQNAKKI